MKAEEIEVGGKYRAKVGSRLTAIEVLEIIKVEGRSYGTTSGTRRTIRGSTHYRVRNLNSGRETTFKTAGKFRGKAIVGVHYAAKVWRIVDTFDSRDAAILYAGAAIDGPFTLIDPNGVGERCNVGDDSRRWPTHDDLWTWWMWYRLRDVAAGQLSPNQLGALRDEFNALTDVQLHRELDRRSEFAANFLDVDTGHWTPERFWADCLPIVQRYVRSEDTYRHLDVTWEHPGIVGVQSQGVQFYATPGWDGSPGVNVERDGEVVGQFQLRETDPERAALEYLAAILKIVL